MYIFMESHEIRKYSLSQKTNNEWNKLSTDCVNASRVNKLKNRIDKYLRRMGYTEEKYLDFR